MESLLHYGTFRENAAFFSHSYPLVANVSLITFFFSSGASTSSRETGKTREILEKRGKFTPRELEMCLSTDFGRFDTGNASSGTNSEWKTRKILKK